MSNHLGIYNYEDMNDSTEFNSNNHILQGIEFNNYSKISNNNKRHIFLENSSSDSWGSIVEAFNGDDSVSNQKQHILDKNDTINDNRDQINKELKKFTTEYNTYSSSTINNLNPEASLETMNKTLDKLKEGFTSNPEEEFETNNHTLNGRIESSRLVMRSMYFHYFVYFTIAITLVAFTFNSMVNPNANSINAIFVVGALLLVFFISRNFGV